jgi:hypothetical protein
MGPAAAEPRQRRKAEVKPSRPIRNATTLAVCGLVLLPLAAGCGGLAGTAEPMRAWQQPELLYLLSEPCDRLYVEVDTIEGVAPPTGSLPWLRRRLSLHCDKPGGVRVARDRPIPLRQAKGKPPELVALLNLDGPPPTQAAGRTAYLYVLFYDSRRLGLPRTEPPYVDGHYPCAIYLDMAHWPRATRHFHRQIIAHELGHVLGLCRNRAHGDGLHCADAGCVMGPRLRLPLHTLLLGLPPLISPPQTLCGRCRQDLRAARALRPDPRMSFRGAMLVRRERGYSVGALPGCVRLWFGDEPELDWPALRRQVRPFARRHADQLRGDTRMLYLCDTPETLRGRGDAVARAAADPDPAVAEVAAGLLDQLAPRAAPSPSLASAMQPQ